MVPLYMKGARLIDMPPVTELEIRSTVHAAVVREEQQNRLIVDEFVIGERGRIDIAVISDCLVGYELKSDLDTLARLPRQMDVFGEVFDFCTLVTTSRHLTRARQILKRGWGLAVVDRTAENVLIYRQVRRAQQRKTGYKLPLAHLLWRDELVQALDTLGEVDGFRSATRDKLSEHLANVTEPDQLRTIVTSAITARQGWRVEKEPDADVATWPHEGVSSRFLARRFLRQRR